MADDTQLGSKHVVVVMDGMQEASVDALRWALENLLTTPAYNLTILVHMPWTIVASRSPVWAAEFESIYTLCQKHNIVPQKKVIMGYPRRLLVVDKLARLSATIAVFDGHHNKYREYLARNVGCTTVMMNKDGLVDMIFFKHEPITEV